MALNPKVMAAVEALNFRVTTGDVASQAGLDVHAAEQGLLALASEAGGHLQVSKAGEIAYQFPKNFRSILRNKSLRLRLQGWLDRIGRALFYLLRISFGILLLLSILLVVCAIAVIVMAASASQSDRDDGGGFGGGGGVFLPRIWFGPDLFWIFYPNYYERRGYYRRRSPNKRGGGAQMNFLEAVFSFLFGDGNPNADLEERRWQTIGSVIRNRGGAIAAEEVAPYLDGVKEQDLEAEDYVLPVLSRFNGRPHVSPEGNIIYHFPELQVTAARQRSQAIADYLEERPWRFSNASPGQLLAAGGLGVANIAGVLFLGNLLQQVVLDPAFQAGFIGFVASIYGLLLLYAVGFVTVPLVRYLWVNWRNGRVTARNHQRQVHVAQLKHPGGPLQQKLAYAQQFAAQTVITADELAYTTETDLTTQEIEQSDEIDEAWRRRLGQSR
ncbi:MAG: hypothetical protein AAF289_20115 [Cyanobacteria bacterium P01_A01_bin.135]